MYVRVYIQGTRNLCSQRRNKQEIRPQAALSQGCEATKHHCALRMFRSKPSRYVCLASCNWAICMIYTRHFGCILPFVKLTGPVGLVITPHQTTRGSLYHSYSMADENRYGAFPTANSVPIYIYIHAYANTSLVNTLELGVRTWLFSWDWWCGNARYQLSPPN